MGNTQAQGFAEAVEEGQISLRNALSYQLTANHYPPYPTALIDVAEEAVNLGQEELWDQEIELPEGIEFRDQPFITVADAVETFHLDAFLAECWEEGND